MAAKQSTAASQTAVAVSDAFEPVIKLGLEEVNAMRRALADGLCFIGEVERIRSEYDGLVKLGGKLPDGLRPLGNQAHYAIDHISTALIMLDGIGDSAADAGSVAGVAPPTVDNLATHLGDYSRTFWSLSALFAAIAKLAPDQSDAVQLAALGRSVAMEYANDADVDREELLSLEVPA